MAMIWGISPTVVLQRLAACVVCAGRSYSHYCCLSRTLGITRICPTFCCVLLVVNSARMSSALGGCLVVCILFYVCCCCLVVCIQTGDNRRTCPDGASPHHTAKECRLISLL